MRHFLPIVCVIAFFACVSLMVVAIYNNQPFGAVACVVGAFSAMVLLSDEMDED